MRLGLPLPADQRQQQRVFSLTPILEELSSLNMPSYLQFGLLLSRLLSFPCHPRAIIACHGFEFVIPQFRLAHAVSFLSEGYDPQVCHPDFEASTPTHSCIGSLPYVTEARNDFGSLY
jgi:hypothetical protein